MLPSIQENLKEDGSSDVKLTSDDAASLWDDDTFYLQVQKMIIASLIVTNSINHFSEKFKLVTTCCRRIRTCEKCSEKPKFFILILYMTAQQTLSFGIVWTTIYSMNNSTMTLELINSLLVAWVLD